MSIKDISNKYHHFSLVLKIKWQSWFITQFMPEAIFSALKAMSEATLYLGTRHWVEGNIYGFNPIWRQIKTQDPQIMFKLHIHKRVYYECQTVLQKLSSNCYKCSACKETIPRIGLMQLYQAHLILGHFQLKRICQVDPVLLLMNCGLLC